MFKKRDFQNGGRDQLECSFHMTTDGSRPDISAELRRRVLLEAGHRCAIPTCRHMEVDLHHIIPWSEVREHEYENLIALCPNCHRSAHRGDIDRKSLRAYKANLRLAHDKFSRLELDYLFKYCRVLDCTPYPSFMRLLYERLIEAGFVTTRRGNNGIVASVENGVNTTPVRFLVTEKGRRFVESLGG